MCRSALILLFFIAPTLATANTLKQLIGFKSPSGNIHCQYSNDQLGHDVRCDITTYINTQPKKPQECEDTDWGQAFVINHSGKRGQRVCYTDTVWDNSLPVLQYGHVWQHSGFTCRSEKKGITCLNPQDHGFFISKKNQDLF